MYLQGKYIHNLKDEDIVRLIENSVGENLTLEYKRQLMLEDDKSKSRQEFVCDVTAMYNTDGGCIIYGITEKKDEKNNNTGTPESLFAQDFANKDKLQQKINDTIRSNTDPVIANIAMKFLIVNDIEILVIGIPKSLGLPAMVTMNQVNKFYKRNSSGKYAVSTLELNHLFMQNQNLLNKAEEFRNERIHDVLERNIHEPLEMSTSFFLHMIPFSFLSGKTHDLAALNWDQQDTNIYPIQNLFDRNSGYSTTYNYDGFFAFRFSREMNKTFSYNQVFRNGCVETYSSVFGEFPISSNIQNQNYFRGTQMITETVLSIQKAFNLFEIMEIDPPYLCAISMMNVGGLQLLGGEKGNIFQGELKRKDISLPPFIFTEANLSNLEIHQKLKHLFDIVWQTAGKTTSMKASQLFKEG